MQILPQQPVSIAKILDASFKLFAVCFTKIIGFAAILAALYIVLTVLTANLGAYRSVSHSAQTKASLFDILPLMLGYIGITALLSFVLYAAMLYRIDNVAKQHEDSFFEALTVGLKKFPPMVVALILYTLAVIGGSLLLIIPGIAMLLSLSFYPLGIVIDGLGGYAALKASHRLVWGNWWRTLTIYMAPGILMLIVFFTLGFLSYQFGGGAAQTPGSVGTMDIISNLLSALVMPYFYALAYVIYHDLKLRKSGGDLAARLAK